MRILFAYGYSPETTPLYYEAALRKLNHEVVTCGPSKGRPQDIPTEHSVSVLEVLNRLPSGFWPDLVLWSESSVRMMLTDVERSPVLTACYNTEPQLGLFWLKDYAQLFDHVFTSGLTEMGHFTRPGGPDVHFLPMAADPETHGHLSEAPEVHDLCFVGTFNPLVYPERGRYLERIIDLADRHQLKTYIANGVYGREFGRIQAQSRIVFNHSFAGQNLNMRVFEALAAGRLLLTDRCEWARLPEIFRDREHLVYYENPQQFEELLLYYLAHPDERTRIARQGQAEVLARHTYKHRAAELVQAVGEGRATCETPDGRIARRLARLSNGDQAGKAYATSAFYMSFKNESIQRFNELIAECPADGHLWRDLGSAHGEAKQYDLAAREFRRAIRHSPNLIGAYEGLAWVLCELEDWAALEEVAEAGMRLLTAAEPLDFSPGCVFPSFLSWSKTMLTILLTESVAMAPEDYRTRLIEHYDTVLRVLLAKSRIRQAKWSAALETAEPLCSRSLIADVIFSEMAQVYADRGDLAEAERLFRRAGEIQGLNLGEIHELMKLLARQGRWSEVMQEGLRALKFWEMLTALLISVDRAIPAGVLELLGDAFKALSLGPQAVQMWQRSLGVWPDQPALVAKLARG